MRAVCGWAGIVGLVVGCGAWLGVSGGPALAASDEPARRPNIVLVLTDDEDLKAHAFMPKTKVLIEDQGVALDNYFVTYSFCCPSRATILRGQYAFNHRVEGNVLPSGGAHKFRLLGHDRDSVANWLQAAGFHTGYFGKYMNDYKPEHGYVPPGWNEWYGAGSDYFNYVLNENGTLVSYGREPDDYLTDVLARHATASIRRAAAADKPFFFVVAPFAPHAPSISAPRHAHLFADQTYPRAPSFDELDVGEKPSVIRDRPPLEAWQHEAIDRHHRERLRSLQAVDDLVEDLVATLEQTGALDSTYVIYTSDNGWHMGEHRLFVGKTTAYEEDIRVPFVMRGPGVPKGKKLTPFVLNNDLAPTFAAIAGIEPPAFVDGRSFLPLFDDPKQPWRQSFAVERRQGELFELDGTARFDAIRTTDWIYIVYGNGERELYDLDADPYQLSNVVDTADPTLLAQLSERLGQLVNCAGQHCRRIEDAPLAPAIASATDGGSG